MKRSALSLYVGAETFAFFGFGATNIVLPWLILDHTGNPAVSGLVYTVTSVPGFAAAILGGSQMSRWGRRPSSVVTDLGLAVATLAMLAVTLVNELSIGWFIVLGTLAALFRPPGMSARQGMIADVAEVSGWDLPRIAGARQTAHGVAFLAGPAVAGVVLAIAGPVAALGMIAACHAGSAVLITLLPLRRDPAPAGSPSPLKGILRTRRDHTLAAIMVLSFMIELLAAPVVTIVLPAYFKGRSPSLLGLSVAAFALGAVAGALAFAPLAKRAPRPTYVWSLVLLIGGFGLLATLAGVWPIAVGMALAGAGTGITMPFLMVYLNQFVPEEARGRAFGLFNALALASYPIGLGLSGLALRLGATIQHLALGLFATCLLCGIWAVLSPGLRRLADVVREPADHDVLPAGGRDGPASGTPAGVRGGVVGGELLPGPRRPAQHLHGVGTTATAAQHSAEVGGPVPGVRTRGSASRSHRLTFG